jgi:DNA-binding CsgD family transcriptional regulator
MKNLTEREIEILKLVVEEISTNDIAVKLDLSKRTVDTHRRNIIRKTGATNLIGLYKFALQHNIVGINTNI